MTTRGLFYKFLIWKALHHGKTRCDYCKADATPQCILIKRWSIFRFTCYDAILKEWKYNYSLTNKLSEFKGSRKIERFCLKFLVPRFYKKPEEEK